MDTLKDTLWSSEMDGIYVLHQIVHSYLQQVQTQLQNYGILMKLNLKKLIKGIVKE